LPEVIRGEIRAALSHDWAHGDSTLLAVATDDDAIVGMALVSIDTRQRASKSFAALDDLVLLPAVRGGGIGSQLVAWVADELRNHGIARLFLECGAHNLTAQQFFQGRGFKQVSVVMLRELDAATAAAAARWMTRMATVADARRPRQAQARGSLERKYLRSTRFIQTDSC